MNDLSFTDTREKVKILLVDDAQANLEILGGIVSSNGYAYETARNGIEALKKVKTTHPDVILLDVYMPEMGGVEVCKRLKEDPKTRHIPIIVFTAFEDRETKIKCFQAGANDFLAKPVDPLELF